jgi:hypothetical protein
MSFEAIQQEVATWPEEQIRKLRAYLFALDCEKAGEPVSQLTSKLDDPSRKWYTIEEAEKRLGLDTERE